MAGRNRPKPPLLWRLLISSIVAGFLLLVVLPSPCLALPKLIVESGKPRCVFVNVPEGTQLRVEYEAPDLDEEKGPVWITINPSRRMERLRDQIERGAARVEKFRNRKNQKETEPKSEELKAKVGTIKHKIQQDGEVSVCIRASPASSKNPMLFGLAVSSGRSKSEMKKKQDEEHLSGIEKYLDRLSDHMEDILDEADFAKEREMVFHNQSRSMSAATIYWPIVQLSILAITGVTMANHMVRFFKSRHII